MGLITNKRKRLTDGKEETLEAEDISAEEIRITCVLDLPCHLLMDIFCRLPLRSIASTHLVCKAWHDIIEKPYFVKDQSRRAATVMILPVTSPRFKIWTGFFDVQGRLAYRYRLSSTSHWLHRVLRLQLGGSCRGLVCLRGQACGDPVWVWNPLLGTYSGLPRVTWRSQRWGASGIGFSPRSKEYKVIWIEPTRQEAEIVTLGADKWRRIGQAPCSFSRQLCGTFFNWALHWIIYDHDSELICCFDLWREKFLYLPPPPLFFPRSTSREYYWANLGVLNDQLYICASDAIVLLPDIQIWVMQDYGLKESWTNLVNIKFPMVQWWDPYRSIQLVSFRSDEELLLFCGNEELLSYNIRDRSYEARMMLCRNAIVHLPSFISPIGHCLGEMSTTRTSI